MIRSTSWIESIEIGKTAQLRQYKSIGGKRWQYHLLHLLRNTMSISEYKRVHYERCCLTPQVIVTKTIEAVVELGRVLHEK